MKKLLHTIEKKLGIYRWHPMIALRYLPIIAAIKKKKLFDAPLLEVGSANFGIAPYIKQKVVGIDISFTPPFHPDLIPVKSMRRGLRMYK